MPPATREPQGEEQDWAQAAMAARSRRFAAPATKDREVLVASHSSETHQRQRPPSAFSGDAPAPRPTIRSTVSQPAPTQEELPPAPTAQQRRTGPPAPINTDQLLMGEPVGDFVLDGEGFVDGAPCTECDSCNGCGSCGGCGWGCNWLENFSVFGGPHAFKGPVDLGRNGNFGLHEGLNWGAPLWFGARIGYQVGAQILHSNFSGSDVLTPSSASRTQYFITAGIFQRAIPCDPWQWGVAFDWLSDQYYVNMQLAKIRAELSFVGSQGDEIGFWTSIGVDDDRTTFFLNQQLLQTQWTSTDLYAFFFRRHFANCGNGRIWGGFTGNGDGLIGGDFRVPMSDYLSFEGNTNYLIPRDGGSQGRLQESWNLTFNLVWYIGGGARCATSSPWRPLFGVADNSIFMVQPK
jgi:hypothetical protein